MFPPRAIVSNILLAAAVAVSATSAEELITEIHFELFTRRNPDEPQVLELNDTALLQQSNFDNTLATHFFAHGLGGFPSAGYPSKDGYLQMEDCNFISIDWSRMAVGNYSYVATNYIPLAGNLTGQFINFLVDNGADLDLIHLIGHSFGSHVCGFAGAAVTSGKVARISGLDPSHTDEFFPLEDPDSRLDVTDAQFVDIIHSEGRFTVPIGHVDFFPNGGLSQPGCNDAAGGCCSHCRAVSYYEESITTTAGFRSVKCSSWQEFETGVCDGNESVLMGAYVPTTATGSFYLRTNDQSPFALG